MNSPRTREIAVYWLTGLSGAGKTTLAEKLAAHFRAGGQACEILDGDTVRDALGEVGFSRDERDRNVKFVGLIASLLQKNGIIPIVAMISPYRESRAKARQLCRKFFEIHLSTSVADCEQRDVKGLYQKARTGRISNFTGLDDPYEIPQSPELVLDTAQIPVEKCLEKILAL